MSDDDDNSEVSADRVEADDSSAPEERLVTVTAVEVSEPVEDDESVLMDADDPTEHTHDTHEDGEDDEDEEGGDEVDTVRSHMTEEASTATPTKVKETPSSGKRPRTPGGKSEGSVKKGRTPSVAGLTIPFRTVKKAMKLDPDTPIVQNEAAIMTTMAAELFLKSLAKESFRNAKLRGRNTIRYEDIAEARTKNPSLAFLETLLP
jgi:histone H3/H4